MIVTEVLGSTTTAEGRALIEGKHVEKVVLPSEALVKRVQRLTTDHGNELGLRLPQGSPDLRDGDILHVEDLNGIVVEVMPSDVLVITPTSLIQMGFVAHSLGNRHLQAQFFEQEGAMVVQFDHTVVDFLEHHRVPYHRQDRVMPIPFRHAEHTH